MPIGQLVLSMEDAKQKIEDWKWDYNLFRPHSSLNDLTPQEFINLHQKEERKAQNSI